MRGKILLTCARRAVHDAVRSRGGVKIPTGGKGFSNPSPRAPRWLCEGQQIRCKSGADGQSPDGRERIGNAPRKLVGRAEHACSYALIRCFS